jgi:negative regulator of replication initiation
MAIIETLAELLDTVGRLDDSEGDDTARERFRRMLKQKVHEGSQIRDFVEECLSNSGDQFNKALQDLVNRVGELLEFDVEYGRYRGTTGQIGFDGLWRSPTGRAIVIETKTTDAYTVKTRTLLDYINALVSEGQIDSPSDALGLYVYGRFDARTNQLENAIIVEGRRDRLRVISVGALLDLLKLKQEYNLDHETILSLLLPTPVQVDPLVELIFAVVAREVEEIETKPEPELQFAEVVSQRREPQEPPTSSAPTRLAQLSDDYTGRTARAIIFQGKRSEVDSWKDAMLTLFELLRHQDQRNFEKTALTLRGRKRPYITRDKDALRMPQLIPNTASLYVETNLSANHIVKLCYTLITEIGYEKAHLTFETEE